MTDFVLARSYPSLMELVSFSKYISLDRKGYYSLLEAAGKNGMDITLWLIWWIKIFCRNVRVAAGVRAMYHH